MEFGILGPLEVRAAGRPVALGGARPRAVLAVLALNANQPVSAERLALALWGEDAPPSAIKTVQVYVARLRKALEDPDALVTSPAGYCLRVRPGELDAERFERQVADGRRALAAGRAEDAAAEFREALELWRGPPLAELASAPFAPAEIARLEEQQLAALEVRVEADLAAGRHSELVGELQQLTSRHPWRERLHAQLMLALYRSGRQADALEAYRHAREVLVERAGTEPGAELRELQAAILAQRPDLMPSATAEGDAAPGDAWLPVARTTLYGRDDDVARLHVLLVAPAARVITLVGPGGVGKTRLAIAAAAAVAEGFPDGVRFVDLSAVAIAEDVAPAIASAVGAPAGETETTPAALVRFFGDRRSLLVLDNFEQVTAAAGVVGQLVARCPELVVVVTSREPLGLSSERRYPVAPLEVDLPGAPAVAMFLDRADARAPGYGEGETRMLDVERICRGLDGLPLALELAAARAPLLSPRELADRLTRVLDVLGPGPSDAPARQRTLRATLEWSVRLLDEEERAAFARLGAFAGGMTIAAAEAVAGVGLDTLDSLVAKQLLARRGDRLVMLETVRAFALERLAEDPQASTVRRALAGWCLDGLRAGNPRIRGRERRARLAQLEAELANAVASLGWAIEVSDSKLAMDLAAELGTFWWNTGRREEGIRWLGLALETAPDSDPADLAAVLLARARLTHRRDMPAYRRDLEAALTRFTEVADRGGMALALAYLSYVEASTGRADAAADLARRARALADECGDELIRGTVLGETETVVSRHEDVDQMRREAVELLSRNDDLVGVAFTCSVAGYEALAARRDSDALPWLEEGATAARLSGHLASLCHVHNNLGLARLFTADVDGATEALATALRLARPAGFEHLADEAVLAMSAIRLRQGDPTDTAAALRTAASTESVITRRPDEQVVWARIEDELIAPYRFHLDKGSAAARSPQLSPTQAIELAIAETERAVTAARAR